jgi:hypothetical protein
VTRLNQIAVSEIEPTRTRASPAIAVLRPPHGPRERPFIESKRDVADHARAPQCAEGRAQRSLIRPFRGEQRSGTGRRRTARTALEVQVPTHIEQPPVPSQPLSSYLARRARGAEPRACVQLDRALHRLAFDADSVLARV